MKHGFVKVAAVTPKIVVADTAYNADMICDCIAEASAAGAKVIVLPELCITGYTCGDLFLQEKLLREAKNALLKIAGFTRFMDCLIFVGLPYAYHGKLYNVAAAISEGKILGFVPKTCIPNYNEFYESRYFAAGMEDPVLVEFTEDIVVPMGAKLLFACKEMPELKVGVEICEDLWTPQPPSISHALNGATLIVNLSASDEVTGKDIYRKELVKGQSARLLCGYVFASAGEGESTTDVVYSAHNLIAEDGHILAEAKRFANETIYSEIDFCRMDAERRRMSTFVARYDGYTEVPFSLERTATVLTRKVEKMPFVPQDEQVREKRCEEILHMQAMGLKKRLEHTHCKNAVIGISGGLDSTLALLVTVKAFDLLGLPRENIKAVTMPGFGTTDRTYENAVNMIKCVGAEFSEVSIKEAVILHFKDIGHDINVHDVTYENSQARERTQILMDIANRVNGMVVGTGDLSELALGWATYNGDHMSMYAVNGSVPKTLVRHLVRYYAKECGDETLKAILLDVLDTPVSPELLPPTDGEISQKTEDLVGPYELHDFFLYYMLRMGYAPEKIYRLAKYAFEGAYDHETLLKWLKNYYRRFFSQQFKRSCLPDGPKVGSVDVSPRGGLRMPSDASAAIWLAELEKIEC
ncbi:MAG: NAD(+) synthase [Roseburia sp.]|nr:NAD(+) synthase [Roseburia sp.]